MEERVEYGKRDKICPLLSQPWMDERFPASTYLIAKAIACKEDKCAWWDAVESRCIVVTLAVNVLLDRVRVPQLPSGGAAD